MEINLLKAKKKELNMTIEELSKKSGVPIGTLNKIFAGQTQDPKFETIKSICRAMGVSLVELDEYEVQTIAAHHDGDEWTEEELEEIERFKAFVRSKRK